MQFKVHITIRISETNFLWEPYFPSHDTDRQHQHSWFFFCFFFFFVCLLLAVLLLRRSNNEVMDCHHQWLSPPSGTENQHKEIQLDNPRCFIFVIDPVKIYSTFFLSASHIRHIALFYLSNRTCMYHVYLIIRLLALIQWLVKQFSANFLGITNISMQGYLFLYVQRLLDKLTSFQI